MGRTGVVVSDVLDVVSTRVVSFPHCKIRTSKKGSGWAKKEKEDKGRGSVQGREARRESSPDVESCVLRGGKGRGRSAQHIRVYALLRSGSEVLTGRHRSTEERDTSRRRTRSAQVSLSPSATSSSVQLHIEKMHELTSQ